MTISLIFGLLFLALAAGFLLIRDEELGGS